MRKSLRFSVVLTVALAAGCASGPRYLEPTVGQASATLQITSSHSGALSSNLVLICSQLPCEPGTPGARQLAAFNWAQGSEKTVRLPAGTQIFLAVRYARNSPEPEVGAIMWKGTTCRNIISFVPISGASYTAHQRLGSDGCILDLKDSRGVAPPSLMSY